MGSTNTQRWVKRHWDQQAHKDGLREQQTHKDGLKDSEIIKVQGNQTLKKTKQQNPPGNSTGKIKEPANNNKYKINMEAIKEREKYRTKNKLKTKAGLRQSTG